MSQPCGPRRPPPAQSFFGQADGSYCSRTSFAGRLARFAATGGARSLLATLPTACVRVPSHCSAWRRALKDPSDLSNRARAGLIRWEKVRNQEGGLEGHFKRKGVQTGHKQGQRPEKGGREARSLHGLRGPLAT